MVGEEFCQLYDQCLNLQFYEGNLDQFLQVNYVTTYSFIRVINCSINVDCCTRVSQSSITIVS